MTSENKQCCIMVISKNEQSLQNYTAHDCMIKSTSVQQFWQDKNKESWSIQLVTDLD